MGEKKREGEKKGEGDRNKKPPSDRSGYGSAVSKFQVMAYYWSKIGCFDQV